MKKTFLQWAGYAALMTGLLLTGACKDNGKDPKPNPTPTVSQETQERNAFAQLIMTDVYLWSAEAEQTINSQKLDYKTETDPIAFFDKLVYKDDRWSEMTNQIAETEEEFSGTKPTFGYSLLAVSFVDANEKPTGEYCAVVAYVYKDSPAEKAGLKRGDILILIDGKAITKDTYSNLYYSPTIKVDLGVYTVGQGISLKGQTVSMTAIKMYEDPIVYQNVIEKGGKKIGYLFYTNYVLGKDSDPYSGLNDLIRVFQEFQDQGVEEVVLDLRYNGGGYALTSEVLCDILAPQSAMGQVMTKQISNTKYAKYWTGETLFSDVVEIGEDDGSVTKIPVPVDLNLSRLYVLTSGNTASASESTIIGLKPYLNLVQIGTTTHGKYCGGILATRDVYTETKNIASLKNWGAYTMIYKFTNKDNITFVNGLSPQHTVKESIWDMAPIGDESDPLLAKALEAITGTRSAFTRGLTFEGPAYQLIPDAPLKTNALDGKMIDSQAWDKIKEVR